MKGKSVKKTKKKALIAAAVSLVVLLAASATAYAWFTTRRQLDTITRISSPVLLKIGAGHKEDSSNIDMGGIDVTDSAKKKDFVFCVYSDETVGDYKIQLAHTTNIAFSYTIYRADEYDSPQTSLDVVYVDKSDVSHYYKKGTELTGKYLNKSAEGTANNSLHEKSYGSYNNVQKNAEPLYWQNDDKITPTPQEGTFVDYYILEVSWGEDVINNKETDMVYLTAGMT